MAGDRTLKLSILADISNLTKNLGAGSKEVDSFGTQIGEVAKKATLAFAAIGSAIAGVSVAFAKAAAEDEMAANKLSQTIDSVTNATNEQIKAVQNYITTTSIATGITDDQLRPAFERLVRSTKSVEDATKLLNLALDLSAATTKPLEQVAAALGRAYDGNTTALGKLGLGLDASTLKSKDFNAIYETLNETFGEFSENRSQEAIIKFQRLQVALDEAKEAVGAALLPAFEALGDWLLTEGVPRLNAFIAGLVGDDSLTSGYNKAQKAADDFGRKTRNVIDTLIEYKDVAFAAATITATIWAVTKIQAAVVATIGFINLLIKAYNALKTSAIVAAVASRLALNPLAGAAASAAVFAAIGLAAKAASEFDTDTSEKTLSYNQQREAQIAGSSGGGIGGGGSFTGGAGIGGGVTISSGGSTERSISAATEAKQTLIEQVSQANAEKYFAPAAPTYGISEVRQREMAADSGVFQSIPSGFDVASARRGDEVGNVIINVNAPSAIDGEGFKRAVVDALNESANRGTGGGGALRFSAAVL
jgi:hypothetical protein